MNHRKGNIRWKEAFNYHGGQQEKNLGGMKCWVFPIVLFEHMFLFRPAGVFEMSHSGLEAVSNTSGMFLSEQDLDSDILAGLAVVVSISFLCNHEMSKYRMDNSNMNELHGMIQGRCHSLTWNLSANNFKGNIPVELGHIVNLGTYLAIIFQAMSQLQMVI
ncbi:DNA repair protein RadA protein [Trifolium repens]|nr:DNA repair protein RadA protein [Trifolium repens]